ncbi:sugar ABC transporter substrate-binding protein [Metabacillus rhizolycopersici]|uniref:Sugar ABC transporter substrate-binding protein n=1 Tax=Metabacillus rhizolycopersici TaxID=2875709 RepID=A0ABS7UU45_9BACI|nr:sugar ABC transporter substrate-binding protein [Metabacillus rhizolycopersici]MBZ5751830.1 sugar ABC transporter substrate-binding protein [Metabacillus rhizolycopersici]
MLNYYKKILLILTVFVLAVLSACSNSDKGNSATEANGSEDSYEFGVVLMSLNSEYWKIVMAGAEDAAKELGVDVQFFGPPEEAQYEQQIKMVEDLVVSGADAIIVAPSQADAIIPALNSADQQGVPIVLADADAEFEKKVSFIGTENFDAGKLGGEFVSEQLDLKDGDKVAIIRGQLGSKTHDDRTNGFKGAMQGENIEFIVQDAKSDRVQAVNAMENILTANSDIKAVFATSDEMALGAIQALENKGKTDIPVIGFDGTPNGLDALKNGKMLANIAQKPYEIGYQAVETAYKAKQGEEVEKRIDSGATVITKENVEETIKEINGYLGK